MSQSVPEINTYVGKVTVPLVTSLITLLETKFGNTVNHFLQYYFPGIRKDVALVIGIALGIAVGLLIGIIFSYFITCLVNRLLWGTDTDNRVHQLCVESIQSFETYLQRCCKQRLAAQQTLTHIKQKLLAEYACLKKHKAQKTDTISPTLTTFINHIDLAHYPMRFLTEDALKPAHSIIKSRAQKKLVLALEYFNFRQLPYSLRQDNGSFLRRFYRFISLPSDYKTILAILSRPGRFDKSLMFTPETEKPTAVNVAQTEPV